MINLTDYQKKAITTKIYKDEIALPYVVLGLVGESTELFEKFLQFEKGEIVNPDSFKEEIKKEIGDVMWYLAANASELNKNFGDIIIDIPINPIKNSQILKNSMNLILICSGRIAEIMKKYLRDNFGEELNEIKEKSIIENLNTIYNNIKTFCIQLDFSLEEIMEGNLLKLESRKKREKLKGEGDNR